MHKCILLHIHIYHLHYFSIFTIYNFFILYCILQMQQLFKIVCHLCLNQFALPILLAISWNKLRSWHDKYFSKNLVASSACRIHGGSTSSNGSSSSFCSFSSFVNDFWISSSVKDNPVVTRFSSIFTQFCRSSEMDVCEVLIF